MKQIEYNDVFDEELAKDAIINDEYIGFKEDYLILHVLLKRYRSKIKTFLEVGTNMGTGTNIIKNALGENCNVLSLDLPTELAHISLQHPINEGKGDNVGSRCKLPYTQLRGDSMKYDYTQHYPIDGWFIDSEHDYYHPRHESMEAIKSLPQLIIWHDADMMLVNFAIRDTFQWVEGYDVFMVAGTRIAFAIKK